jgi:hypothetical protein
MGLENSRGRPFEAPSPQQLDRRTPNQLRSFEINPYFRP